MSHQSNPGVYLSISECGYQNSLIQVSHLQNWEKAAIQEMSDRKLRFVGEISSDEADKLLGKVNYVVRYSSNIHSLILQYVAMKKDGYLLIVKLVICFNENKKIYYYEDSENQSVNSIYDLISLKVDL
jgi:hypothetical protein